MWSRQAAIEGETHIVPLPRWTSIIRFLRFATAFAVIGLVAAVTSMWGGFAAFTVTIFTSSATLIISGYYLIATETKPVLYNRWAVLGLEIFNAVFWLASFALLASWSATHTGTYSWYGPDNSRARGGHQYHHSHTHRHSKPHLHAQRYSTMFKEVNRYHAGEQLAAVAAGLGAWEFLLSVVILIVFSLNLHKHRRAGFNAVYGTSQTTGSCEERGALSVTAFAEPEDIVPDLKI